MERNVASARKNIMENQTGFFFNQTVGEDCRQFRVEIRTPDRKIRFYSLRSNKKGLARLEANELVRDMIEVFQDERIMWRMTGDKNWSFGSVAVKNPNKSMLSRVLNYFFDLED